MNAAVEVGSERFALLTAEIAKVPAFLRRDLLVSWSYRVAFLSDAMGLLVQAILFYLVGLMVDPSKLPAYGGSTATYMEFVAIGIALGVFVQLGLTRMSAGLRQEQLMGTLESLLITPTSPATIQLGSVAYYLMYVPLRTALFLALVAFGFGLDLKLSGLVPAALILIVFVPFVWGLGVASAAWVLTFRRGGGVIGIGAALGTVFSGAYFPLHLLPGWARAIAEVNPISIALEGMRQTLLGGAGWSEVAPELLILIPISALSLTVGLAAFRLALRRERRLGTLGLY